MTNTAEKEPAQSAFALTLKTESQCTSEKNPIVHAYGKNHICITDEIGYAIPGNRSRLELVVDSSEGFIPLWKQSSVLRWEFDENSLAAFSNSEAIKEYVRELFADALIEWDYAVPIRFSENSKSWDFRLRVEADTSCSPSGCTLARAFFPGSGRNNIALFPTMFEQTRKEQVDTMIHELGHVFGLRHFFAQLNENAWPRDQRGQSHLISGWSRKIKAL